MRRNHTTNPQLPATRSWTLLVLLSLLFVVNPFNTLFVKAQETQQSTKTPVSLNAKEWKAVEGIFQSSANKDMYVQFSARDSVLVAKLLWNNGELHLKPESALAFSSSQEGDQESVHIIFSKDSTGTVNQVNVANNGVWNRTNDYKPIVKKEIAHTPEQLKPFEGLYRLQNDTSRFIEFRVEANILILKQHWDGNEIPFVPETELDFFSKISPLFSLSFTKDNSGKVTQVLAFKRDLWIKTKKVKLTGNQLKAFEGKYQFKDDPDNYIQISVTGDNLAVKQLWDGKEIIVEPQTDTYFYNKEQSYSLQAFTNKDGAVTQVVVLGNDAFNKVEK